MSNEISDEKLSELSRLATPAPSEAARQRALDAALLAFDQANHKSASVPQAAGWTQRLRDVVHNLRGNWIMDTRVTFGLGTAAVALLLLPLGYQLYTSTMMTPIDFEQRDPVGPITTTVPADGTNVPVLATEDAPEAVKPEVDATVRGRDELADVMPEPKEGEASLGPLLQEEVGVESRSDLAKRQIAASSSMDAAGAAAPLPVTESFAPGVAMSAEQGMATPTDPSGNEFTDFDESPVKIVAEEPVSTFSIDVDTASYS